MPRLGQPALVGTLLTAALAVGACARSVAPAAPPEEPDARGCSDWPSRPGASLLSLDGASQFEVESHLVARGDELAIAWEGGLTPSLDRRVPDWLGDYFGWATTADGFATTFVDNASGLSHVAFQVIVAPRRQP